MMMQVPVKWMKKLAFSNYRDVNSISQLYQLLLVIFKAWGMFATVFTAPVTIVLSVILCKEWLIESDKHSLSFTWKCSCNPFSDTHSFPISRSMIPVSHPLLNTCELSQSKFWTIHGDAVESHLLLSLQIILFLANLHLLNHKTYCEWNHECSLKIRKMLSIQVFDRSQGFTIFMSFLHLLLIVQC